MEKIRVVFNKTKIKTILLNLIALDIKSSIISIQPGLNNRLLKSVYDGEHN